MSFIDKVMQTLHQVQTMQPLLNQHGTLYLLNTGSHSLSNWHILSYCICNIVCVEPDGEAADAKTMNVAYLHIVAKSESPLRRAGCRSALDLVDGLVLLCRPL